MTKNSIKEQREKNYSVNMNELTRLLEGIEKEPCDNKKGHEDGRFIKLGRLEFIDKSIRSANSAYKLINGKKNYYKLYGQSDLDTLAGEFDRVILVSSHADNLQEVSSFDKSQKPGYINGCFDNASTNAICTYLMMNDSLPRNVLFGFTADEEGESRGAEKLGNKLAKYFGRGNVDVIVLDVTYGWQEYMENGKRKKSDFSIENDYIYKCESGYAFIKKVCDVANESGFAWKYMYSGDNEEGYLTSTVISHMMDEGFKGKAQVDGEDEASDYDEFHFNAFSLCLPCSADTEKKMHSPNGFLISEEIIKNYTTYLHNLLVA